MKSDFLDTLEDRVLIGDGAMGTELYTRGVGLDVNFDELNVTRPDLVQSIHHDYVQAGAQFLEANTYGASRGPLPGHGLADRLTHITAAAVRRCGRPGRRAQRRAGGRARRGIAAPPGCRGTTTRRYRAGSRAARSSAYHR